MSSKVAENFRQNSAVEGPVPSYPDTGYDWSMDKFCDPATRDATIALLFVEADKYTGTVKRVKHNQEPINMARFTTLVHQVSGFVYMFYPFFIFFFNRAKACSE